MSAVSRTGHPDVEGPITGGRYGRPFGAALDDLVRLGYIEEEYFLSGEALRYRPTRPLLADGHWDVTGESVDSYRTRVLVRRPGNPQGFNGTVVVEWVNVSSGFDVNFAVPPSLFNGLAYVAVSAQPLGVDGFDSWPHGLTRWDRQRYGNLYVRDDALGYDIFTQVARLLRRPLADGGGTLLGGQQAELVVGVGASQSGTRVLAYANAIQPVENVFDALMPLICAGTAADFAKETAHPDPGAGQYGHSRSRPTRVRNNLATPVLSINSETEALHYAPLRQRDTDQFRSWEIAGASHAPAGQVRPIVAIMERDGVEGPNWTGGHASEVMWLPTFDAALGHIRRWVHDGVPPPTQPPIQMNGSGSDITRDDYGNAVGGVRLPELEVPIATYRGDNPENELSGTTTPLPPQVLARLYPSHQDYVNKVTAAAHASATAGVILPRRAIEYRLQAEQAPSPGVQCV